MDFFWGGTKLPAVEAGPRDKVSCPRFMSFYEFIRFQVCVCVIVNYPVYLSPVF